MNPMEIVVPQLGESVIEARVARWLKKDGEPVTPGEPLVELETDKIDLEVGADPAGVLSRIVGKDGDDVKVGELLGVMDQQAAGSGQQAARQRAAGTQHVGRTWRRPPHQLSSGQPPAPQPPRPLPTSGPQLPRGRSRPSTA